MLGRMMKRAFGCDIMAAESQASGGLHESLKAGTSRVIFIEPQIAMRTMPKPREI